MKMKLLVATLCLGITSALFAADKLKSSPAERTLPAGAYTATAKAIVCEGCGQFITDTLSKNPALTDVRVEPKTKTVFFTVKKGSSAKLQDLQKALKASADQMGMGADYTLSDIQKAQKA